MTKAKTVLVTGGANGIGWATAQHFARLGWKVAIGDLDMQAAERRVREEKESITVVRLDVREQQSVDSAFSEVVGRFGKLDSLINNAGVQKWTSFASLDWNAWSLVIDVNLHGVLRCLHAASRYMLRDGGGSIVNVTSVNGVRGVKLRGPYSAAKAGVIALTRTAAVEWAAQGIRVNAIGPGYVGTERIDQVVASGQLDAEALLDRIPMGRMGTPDEIARVIRFLASDDSAYITGQVLFVDGGYLADSGLPGGASDK